MGVTSQVFPYVVPCPFFSNYVIRVSRRQAAKELNIGYATLKRLLDAHNQGLPEE
jgi:hypothetical protein